MGLYQSMAEAMPKLSHLECKSCGHRMQMSTAACARYLSSGWPTCCGATMYLFTQKEADARAKVRKP